MSRRGLCVVTLLTLITVSVASLVSDHDFDSLWERFKARHAKRYATNDEEQKRRHIWADNIRLIHEHNLETDLGEHSFTLGLNVFADWSLAEFRQHLNGFRGTRQQQQDADTEDGHSEMLLTSTSSSLPSSVNWVQRGWVTDVKNQGQCGCCYTFAAAGALEGQLFNKTRKLTSLSAQNLIDCSTAQGNMGCDGGVTDWAFKYVKQNGGLQADSTYPFTGTEGTCAYKASNSIATCSGWVDVPRGSEQALQQAVATVGPVAVAIDASSVWFQLYRSGVYSSSSCSSTDLDHAVLAVGYGTENGQDYWLVKNSWGTKWGEDGYIKMERNNNNMCGIATQASYPTM